MDAASGLDRPGRILTYAVAVLFIGGVGCRGPAEIYDGAAAVAPDALVESLATPSEGTPATRQSDAESVGPRPSGSAPSLGAVLPAGDGSAPVKDTEDVPQAPAASRAPTESEPSELEEPQSEFERGCQAMDCGDFATAAGFFVQVVSMDPSREMAYYNLAVCHETLGDRQAALRTYERLGVVTKKARWLDLAKSRGDALRRQLGHDLLYRARCLAEVNQWQVALEALGRAADLGLPPALDQRARSEYYRVAAAVVAERLAGEIAVLEAGALVLGEFAAESPDLSAEARDFRAAVFDAVAQRLPFPIEDRAGPDDLADAGPDANGPDEAEGYEPRLTALVGRRISLRLVTRMPPRTLATLAFDRKGAVPPAPTRREWHVLPVSALGDGEMDVEVWADTESVAPRAQMLVRARPSQDSFVAVFRVRTDGRIRRVFPTGPDSMAFIRGGQTVEVRAYAGRSAPDGSASTGFWAVAAAREMPLRIDGLDGLDAAQRLRDALVRMPEARWVASTFRVRIQ